MTDNSNKLIEILESYDKKSFNYLTYLNWDKVNFNSKLKFNDNDLNNHIRRMTPKKSIFQNIEELTKSNLVIVNNKIIKIRYNNLINLKLKLYTKENNKYIKNNNNFSLDINKISKDNISFIYDEFNVALYIKVIDNSKKIIFQNTLLQSFDISFEYILKNFKDKYLLWEWANINSNKNNSTARNLLEYGLTINSNTTEENRYIKSLLINSKIKYSIGNVGLIRSLIDSITPSNSIVWTLVLNNVYSLIIVENYKELEQFYLDNN